ncbi:MAG: hypothetical protein KDH96_08330 [Candidatus Riesia sp.]|nr:hypothetical protein [Candidatus Riesia sp.]
MANFLDKIISVLPDSQKAAIKSLIATKVAIGELSSIRARQQESLALYNRVKSKLNNILLNPKYAVKDAKISSADINSNLEEIYLDLNSLYSTIASFSGIEKSQNVVLDGEYQKSRAVIEKLINDVKVYSLKKRHPEFNEVKLVDFNSSTNTTSKIPSAVVNPETRLLQLYPFYTNRTHILNRTTRNTKIYTKTYSQGLKGDLAASFPVENMVDQKSNTFWGTIILSDAPVSQVYSKNTSTGDEYQIAVDGPVVEIYFKFSHTEKINNIKILPFSEFPVKIIDVAYKATTSSQIHIPVSDFEETSTLDWVELNFPPVLASEVKITIAQENYKKIAYLLPKSAVVNTDLFQRILKLKASKVIGTSIFDSDFSLYLLSTISSYESAVDSLEKLLTDYPVDSTIQPNLEYYDDIVDLISKTYAELSPTEVKDVTNRLSSREVNQQPSDALINLFKYEYLLGLREVEINYQLYYPTSYYESEEFLPNATVSEIQLEVDERHSLLTTSWQNDYKKTSTEWDIDLGAGRKIPIHPINIVDNVDEIPAVTDELINFNINTHKAYTRLGGYYSVPYRVKKNGEVIPPTEYSTVRTTGSVPKIEITMTGDYFDVNSIYTIDYAVDPSSYNIDILSKFTSEQLISPEIFTEVGSDKEVILSKFPFINYSVINLTGYFQKEDESVWTFIKDQDDVYSGQLSIVPSIYDSAGNLLQTGSITGSLVTGSWGDQSGISPVTLSGNADLSLSYFGDINGVQFSYFLKIMDSNTYAEVESFFDGDTLILKDPIEVTQDQCQRWDSLASGEVFSGTLSPASGYFTNANYTLGVGVKTDGQIYALSNVKYNPMTVYVAGKEAKNITDYVTLVHPAFSVGSNKDSDVEYIHAGKTLYFNQDLTGKEIRVYYNWLTEYVKILGTLRFNGQVNPNLTPKVNEIRLFLNNLII